MSSYLPLSVILISFCYLLPFQQHKILHSSRQRAAVWTGICAWMAVRASNQNWDPVCRKQPEWKAKPTPSMGRLPKLGTTQGVLRQPETFPFDPVFKPFGNHESQRPAKMTSTELWAGTVEQLAWQWAGSAEHPSSASRAIPPPHQRYLTFG